MKQIIIGVVLAVLLVGCAEKPKFSIKDRDNITYYGLDKYRAIFTEVVAADPNGIAYKFTATPESVFGIKTSDLDMIGGYVFKKIDSYDPSVTVHFKGKKSFGKLMQRIKHLYPNIKFDEVPSSVEKGNGVIMVSSDRQLIITVIYEPFIDIVKFSIMNR